mmetsp:Transcript_26442/g.27481  ORF Transcript_26442/g.27481 Transcript_26442/m.27481 type:complete len:269 (-) Transcript_26442:93-899(-)
MLVTMSSTRILFMLKLVEISSGIILIRFVSIYSLPYFESIARTLPKAEGHFPLLDPSTTFTTLSLSLKVKISSSSSSVRLSMTLVTFTEKFTFVLFKILSISVLFILNSESMFMLSSEVLVCKIFEFTATPSSNKSNRPLIPSRSCSLCVVLLSEGSIMFVVLIENSKPLRLKVNCCWLIESPASSTASGKASSKKSSIDCSTLEELRNSLIRYSSIGLLKMSCMGVESTISLNNCRPLTSTLNTKSLMAGISSRKDFRLTEFLLLEG